MGVSSGAKKKLNLLSPPKVNLPIKKNERPKSHVYRILLPGLSLLEPLLLFKAPGLIYFSFVSCYWLSFSVIQLSAISKIYYVLVLVFVKDSFV